MNPEKRNIFIGIFVIIILAGIFFFISYKKEAKNKNIENNSDTASTTIVNLGDGLKATVPQGYTVERVNDVVKTSVPKPIPSLTRPVVFASNVDPMVKANIETKVASLQATLAKDPKQFNAWIDMGVYHKVAGDYEGAKIYWDYAGKLAPTDFISFGNLGNMYAYQLKDMVKAEQYYNQAIKNAPTQIYLYFQLAEAFRDVSKDIPRAKAVVERGLVANPGNTELVALRDSLK